MVFSCLKSFSNNHSLHCYPLVEIVWAIVCNFASLAQNFWGGRSVGAVWCGEPFTSTRLEGEWAEQEHHTTRTEAMPKSQDKKVRSRGCFAAHLLFFSSRRVGLLLMCIPYMIRVICVDDGLLYVEWCGMFMP